MAAAAAAAAGGGAPCRTFADAENRCTLEIKGPYNPTGISYSTSRPLIFICDPKREGIGETACAQQIAENLAHRAYRRPVTADDISHLMRFYDEGRLDKGTFDQGITEVVAAVLASPDFLFRSIQAPKGRVEKQRVSALRSGIGVAPLLLYLEYGPRRRVAETGRVASIDQARRFGRTGEAHDGRS